MFIGTTKHDLHTQTIYETKLTRIRKQQQQQQYLETSKIVRMWGYIRQAHYFFSFLYEWKLSNGNPIILTEYQRNRGRQPFFPAATILWVLSLYVTCTGHYAPDYAQELDATHHTFLQSRVNAVIMTTTNWAVILWVLWRHTAAFIFNASSSMQWILTEKKQTPFVDASQSLQWNRFNKDWVTPGYK